MSSRSVTLFRGLLPFALGAACAKPSPPASSRPEIASQVLSPAPEGERLRAKLNDTCQRCHAQAAGEHQRSLHHVAFKDASFQRGYVAEPQAFCRACHAPEGDAQAEPSETAQNLGVACVTCHVTVGGTEVRSGLGRQNARAPHPVVRVADFGTAVCAKCHEFSFPGAEGMGERGLMQKTMREHAASSRAADSCASCHMSAKPGASSHAFAVSRDENVLRASVAVQVEGQSPGPRTLRIAAINVGHRLPTGDMFRRLEVRFETDVGQGDKSDKSDKGDRAVAVFPFERSFRAKPNEHGVMARFEASDTRISPEVATRITVPARAKRFRLVYQRATGVMQTPPFTPHVESETVLAEGEL